MSYPFGELKKALTLSQRSQLLKDVKRIVGDRGVVVKSNRVEVFDVETELSFELSKKVYNLMRGKDVSLTLIMHTPGETRRLYPHMSKATAPFKATTKFQPKGYHTITINKGELGKSSKIQEELDELKDAEKQEDRILQLCELSDLVGAIEAYLETQFPQFNLLDLKRMSDKTRAAFRTGARK